jgi:2-polyprenyl-3-methyl-5-hydroxy-6-metoxy-1,4-benzoquinol methylase
MTPIKFLLKKIRLLLLSSQREKNLAKVISKQILLLVKNKSKISILDYGSGFEPLVINLIYKNIKNKYKTININCCDYYTNSQIKKLNEKNNKIKFFKIDEIRTMKRKYDISICADVLHHVGVDNKAGIKKILIFLKNKSKSILIKDHYEYSAFSRQLLRFMDFVGNYYNGVNVPKKYFTKNSIAKILKKSNLKLNKEINDYQYYSKMFLFFSNPKLHFIKILN